MPPHLHRRPPLRQSLPSRGRLLLLPPHYPQTHRQSQSTPSPPRSLPPPYARRPFRHPVLHRRNPSAHRLQRSRSTPSRSPPLRPPDRQRQSSQSTSQIQHTSQPRRHAQIGNRGRDRHRSYPRHPRPLRRDPPTPGALERRKIPQTTHGKKRRGPADTCTPGRPPANHPGNLSLSQRRPATTCIKIEDRPDLRPSSGSAGPPSTI
jgi:hypothetical protein